MQTYTNLQSGEKIIQVIQNNNNIMLLTNFGNLYKTVGNSKSFLTYEVKPITVAISETNVNENEGNK